MRRGHPTNRSALGLVEVLVSILLVGGLLVASLNTLGGAIRARGQLSEQAIGDMLALALISEILNQAYADPDGLVLFGLELNENPAMGRKDFDDVDDYHGFNSSPPTKKAGVAYADRTGWGQQVAVSWANPTNVVLNSLTDQGLKRILVTVTRNGRVISTLTAIKGWGPEGESLDLGIIQLIDPPGLLQ